METDAPVRRGTARRLGRSTAFFSFATGLSRVLGLIREVVAARYFGVSGAMSAFTIAFQVPNLVRALVADSALQGAFVPVFTELLERGERKEAFRVASSLFFLILLILSAVTALFVIFAEPLMTVLAPGFDDNPALQDLTVNLARLMFPIVVLLALSGLVVGMLNSFDHFSVPALAPVAWNAVIIAASSAWCRCCPRTTRSTRTRSGSCWGRWCSSCCRCRGCGAAAAASRSGSTGATSASGRSSS